jgi:alcohol dehydrogenase (cytochrome c)
MFLHIWKRLSRGTGAAILLSMSAGCLVAQNSVLPQSIPSVGKSWPTFNGDTSGRRFSTLKQINKTNVHSLKLAWAFQTHGVTLKSTPLEVDGILYFTVPDYVWAVDAKTGQQVWMYHKTTHGDHLGQRGVAVYKDRVYFGTPDAHLICLDARNGKKIWDVEIADVKLGYYLSVAPLIVKGRVIIGTSGDSTNTPHFIEALDWETGKVVWRTSTLPKPGSPEAKTWPNDKVMSTGGGAAWMTGTYDPELNLMYWGTGNPHPVTDGEVRPGDNLYTCSILALNADTGAIVWYFQASPHDTHDWDAVETPILFDADFNGKPHKLLAQASRNSYFFVLDRKTGKHLLTSQFVPTNWAKGVGPNGSPISNPAEEPQVDGALIHTATGGGTNWQSPSFDPETGLFYVNASTGYTLRYLELGPNHLPLNHDGGYAAPLISKSLLLALDYQTGKVVWNRESGRGGVRAGILTTAGHLLFTADASGNLLALDPSDGKVLWHTRPGGRGIAPAPITYELDGTQYVVTSADSVLYAWTLSGSL